MKKCQWFCKNFTFKTLIFRSFLACFLFWVPNLLLNKSKPKHLEQNRFYSWRRYRDSQKMPKVSFLFLQTSIFKIKLFKNHRLYPSHRNLILFFSFSGKCSNEKQKQSVFCVRILKVRTYLEFSSLTYLDTQTHAFPNLKLDLFHEGSIRKGNLE